MKQIIVLMTMIFLGLQLFSMIAGNDENSISQTLQRVWLQEAEARRIYDQPGISP